MIENNGLRIAFALPDLRGGGAERVSLDLAGEFHDRGHKIDFLLMRCQGELLRKVEQRFRVVDLASSRIRGSFSSLVRYIYEACPDVLIVSMWPLTAVAAAAKVACIGRKKPLLILVEHSVLSVQYADKGTLHRLMLRSSLAFAHRVTDHYVAVSYGVASDIAKLAGVRLDEVSVIHNPVPQFRPAPVEKLKIASECWGHSGDSAFRILSVGSFKAAKNLPLLLKAFKKVLVSVDAKLMLLGDGAQRQELQCLAEKLEISDRVFMPGFQIDTSPFFYSADMFVLSSNREGLPTVLIEALSAGLPVVSTDCKSGPSEILSEGEFGTLVPVNDEDALAKAIVATLNIQPDADKLKARARDFAPDVAAEKYLKLVGAGVSF